MVINRRPRPGEASTRPPPYHRGCYTSENGGTLMIAQRSLLVSMVMLIDQIPSPTPPDKRRRGHPRIYPDRLFLKALALVIMIVRHLHKVHELLAVLNEPTDEMQTLRAQLVVNDRFPTRRTWERRLPAIPDQLPAQIG